VLADGAPELVAASCSAPAGAAAAESTVTEVAVVAQTAARTATARHVPRPRGTERNFLGFAMAAILAQLAPGQGPQGDGEPFPNSLSVMTQDRNDFDMKAETITFKGHGGDEIEAYLAQPLGDGPYGGVVVIHHMPGYDRSSKEVARRFAAEGYLALMPNLYHREAPGASPDDAAAAARARGGVPDERLVGEVAGAMELLKSLSKSNGKVATIGYCSGGRQSFLAAVSLPLDAAVACYPGGLVSAPAAGSPVRSTPLLDRVKDLSCPLLGLFGEEDKYPTPDEVAILDKELSAHGKVHEFHSYPGAGHAFFQVDRPSYRVEAALDGWQRIHDFFARYLAA